MPWRASKTNQINKRNEDCHKKKNFFFKKTQTKIQTRHNSFELKGKLVIVKQKLYAWNVACGMRV